MPAYRKSLIGFRMVYLHMTLAHSNGQSQGRVNAHCEYLVNGDRWDKYCYCQNIGSLQLALNWYIYIWPKPTLKVSQGLANFDCELLLLLLLAHFYNAAYTQITM